MYCDDLLKHVLVQSEVSDQGLELLVFFFELFEAAQFSDAHAGELAFPAVKGLFGDANLKTFACGKPQRLRYRLRPV